MLNKKTEAPHRRKEVREAWANHSFQCVRWGKKLIVCFLKTPGNWKKNKKAEVGKKRR